MDTNTLRRSSGRLFLGLVLIVLGVLYLLDNFGIIYIGQISAFWPVLFILFGIARLLDFDGKSHHNGIWWIFLGAWLLISINGYFGLDFHNSWPILIIGWGASLLWKAFYRQPQISVQEGQHYGN